MPKQFQVEVLGYDDFRKEFSKEKITKGLEIAIGQTAISLHAALRDGVKQRYTFNGTLNSVLAKKSSSARTFGKNIIEADLTYKFVPVALTRFKVDEEKVPATSYFIDPFTYLSTGKKKVIKKSYANAAVAEVVRGRSSTVIGKKGYGGFLIKAGTNETSGKRYRRGVYERQTSSTWLGKRLGVSGIDKRAPIKPLYGPSLSQMARYIYENDPYNEVKVVISKIDELVYRAIFNE